MPVRRTPAPRPARVAGLVVAVALLALGGSALAGCSSDSTATPGASATDAAGNPVAPGASATDASGNPIAPGASGGTGTAAGAASGAKPCVLITGADAATALGLSAPLVARTDTPDACEYAAPNGVDSVAIDVETQAYTPGTDDLVINMMGQDKAKKVTGLGDAAFSYTVDLQVQYHVWAKGKYILIVVTRSAPPAAPDAAANTLATQALTRL